MNLNIISAGAGSGKTYTLTQEMAKLLSDKNSGIRASGILATTFTSKAAAELKERVRTKLLQDGLSQQADELGNALIGTVHSIGSQLLKRFAFEVGLSPQVEILANGEEQQIFNQALSKTLNQSIHDKMNKLANSLGFFKDSRSPIDWQKTLREITDNARSNNISVEDLDLSKAESLSSYFEFLPPAKNVDALTYDNKFRSLVEQTLAALENNGGKVTNDKLTAIKSLQSILEIHHPSQQKFAPWYNWVAMTKLKAGASCKDDIAELVEFAEKHLEHPRFHEDIKDMVSSLFDLAKKALIEFSNYKKERGLIDYIDMEMLLLQLLDNEQVCEVLKAELDLLLVDEFQDTNPMQLAIFLKLSQLVNKAIWVGDPKQSIYGFRGAVPTLMQAIIDTVPEENFKILPNSWRSRKDLVHAVNGLFVKAFEPMPENRIALAVPPPLQTEAEGLRPAIQHLFISSAKDRGTNNKSNRVEDLAQGIKAFYTEGLPLRDKENKHATRPLRLKDMAVLCRTNKSCEELAIALKAEGLNATISQIGLLKTEEALLILAALKFLLNEQDTLAIAEIMRFGNQKPLAEIIQSKIQYNESQKVNTNTFDKWGQDDELIKALYPLRHLCRELSAAEVLDLLLEKTNMRRILATWNLPHQRIANVDKLRAYALEYENSCARLHTAATLGGFILWLENLAENQLDKQAIDAQSDAIQILTYHASKGLEWPVVFMYDLDNSMKDNFIGLRIVHKDNSIDINNPLKGRRICYWLNPYGNQSHNTTLMTNIQNSEAAKQMKMQALEEEARLLYVGLTRARDYLVFTSFAGNRMHWLDRVYQKEKYSDKGKETEVLPLDCPVLTWTWKGETIPVAYKHIIVNSSEIMPNNTSTIYHLEKYTGEQDYESLQLNSVQDLIPELHTQLLESKQFYHAFNYAALGEFPLTYEETASLFAKFILADTIEAKSAENKAYRLACAKTLLQQYGLQESQITAEKLLTYSEAFYKEINAELPFQEKHYTRQFRLSNNTQYFIDSIDFHAVTSKQEHIFVIAVEEQIQVTDYQHLYEVYAPKFYAAAKALTGQSNQAHTYILLLPLQGKSLVLQIAAKQIAHVSLV